MNIDENPKTFLTAVLAGLIYAFRHETKAVGDIYMTTPVTAEEAFGMAESFVEEAEKRYGPLS